MRVTVSIGDCCERVSSSSFGLISVVASGGGIRITVSIGDCQAHVANSLKGCLTLFKTDKVEAYQPIILALIE